MEISSPTANHCYAMTRLDGSLAHPNANQGPHFGETVGANLGLPPCCREELDRNAG